MATHDLDELLTRVAMADQSAFARLYNSTSAKLFGLCLRILGNRALAEEALQEIFVKVWQSADAYVPGRVRPMTWLITIARNHAIDVLRKSRAGPDIAGDPEVIERTQASGPGPAEQLLQKDARVRIDACLNELRPDLAEAVRLAYLQGETYAELAVRFAVPLNTMRTWLRRSLQSLKSCLSR